MMTRLLYHHSLPSLLSPPPPPPLVCYHLLHPQHVQIKMEAVFFVLKHEYILYSKQTPVLTNSTILMFTSNINSCPEHPGVIDAPGSGYGPRRLCSVLVESIVILK